MKPKKMAIGIIVGCGILLSQLALFWGLDVMAKRALLPDIVFEQPYELHGAAEELEGEFALSVNGRYLAWISAGVLRVEDLVARRNCYVGSESADVLVWLPDRSSLLFVADHQLYSLNLEGEVHLNRETEVSLPAYTYFYMGVSTYTNVIYLMGKNSEGEQGVLRMDLTKNLVWLERPRGTVCSRICVSNRTGAVMMQGETGEGPRLFYLKGETWMGWEPESGGEPGETKLEFPAEADAAENRSSYVLLGADDGGFYVGAMDKGNEEKGKEKGKEKGDKGLGLQGGDVQSRELELLYYVVEMSGGIDPSPVVLWKGSLPTASQFLPFAVGAGFLAPAEEAGAGIFSVLKMTWGANRQAGPMETYMLGAPLLPEEAGRSLHLIFASNGLTYLEIRGGVYCWRLMVR
ncbi:MAG: hypothetical protein FWG14_10800 [Peptococcaceae bacterium]|nr:hypothetical protein [Peptococcaceae bacterium]